MLPMYDNSNPNNRISKRRLVALVSVICFVFTVYAFRLFQIQIVEGEYYAAQANRHTQTKVDIPASRGEILDRYLRPMAVNRTTFSLALDGAFFPRGTGEEAKNRQNEILLRLTSLLTERGEEWNDTLPITKTAPFTFEEGREDSVSTLRKKLELADYATVENCMDAMIERYYLSGYTPEQQRLLAGIQYEMETRGFALKTPYTFSSDISRETAYIIKENNTVYPGVTPQATPVREYVSKNIAAHLIGTVGPIYPEEYAELKEKGYQLNDTVGKGGIEAAMEDALRGQTGVRVLERDSSGSIVDEFEQVPAVAGDSVVLTLDMNLQKTTQEILISKIEELRQKQPTATKQWVGQDVRSGSVVLLDVKTGEVLVCASEPGYDLSTYQENYTELANDPGNPLFNRALSGTFACGSTIKPAVAVASLMEGIINMDSQPDTAFCDGRYHYYEDVGFAPRCTGRHGHPNVVTAIQKSCNSFFFDMGRQLGYQTMNNYFTIFGFGQKTGIEIGEATGTLSSPESYPGTWVGGNNCQMAIGQLNSQYTPIQLAACAMTLANNGVRYKTHLVHSVRSYDGKNETVTTPEIAAELDMDPATIEAVRQGMLAVTSQVGGTAYKVFRDAPYAVAGKTGTAQNGKIDSNGNSDRSDHGAFIGYAPADNPQVAISVVMENGTSTPAAEVARAVLDAYFSSKSSGMTPTPEQELLP